MGHDFQLAAGRDCRSASDVAAALQDEVGLPQRDEHPAGPVGRERQDADLAASDQGHLGPVAPGLVAKAVHEAHLAALVWALLEELESAVRLEQEPRASLRRAAALQAAAQAALRE
jgi:hypothetical protein